MEYTKGEWRAVKGNNQMTWMETTVCQLNYHQSKDEFHIIISDAEKHGDEETTAKLIAAAPNLLNALIHAPILSKFNDAELFIEAYEKWRDFIKYEAIKKATE